MPSILDYMKANRPNMDPFRGPLAALIRSNPETDTNVDDITPPSPFKTPELQLPAPPSQSEMDDINRMGPKPYLNSTQTASTSAPALEGLNRALPVQVDPNEIAAALAGMKARQGDDPNLKWHAMKEAEKSDIETGLTNPFILSNPAKVAALHTQLGQVEGDLNDPNDFINRMRTMSKQTEQAQHAAGLGGFNSPQDAAAWQRKQEEAKISSPLDVEKARGQFGIDTEKLKGATAEEVERMKAEAYGNRSMYDLMKAREADQAKRDVAETTGKSRVSAAGVRAIVPELGRQGEAIEAGKFSPSDPNVVRTKGAFEQMLQNAAPQLTGQEIDPDQFVKQQVAAHPGWSLAQHLQAIDPDGQQFDSPSDKQLFIQTLQRHGIR